MQNKKGIIFAILAALTWSIGGVFIKLVNAPPFYIAMARSFIAFITFLPFVKFSKIKISKNLILLFLCYSYTLISFVVATKLTTASNAIIIQYTSPIWLFLVYSYELKKIQYKKLISVSLVLIGILLFLFEAKNGSNSLGNLIALTSSFSFAGVGYFSAKKHSITGPSIIALCNLSTFLLAIPFTKDIIATTLSLGLYDIVGLLILGSIQIAVGYLFYLKALKLISPLDTSIICLLEPLLNPIWVFIFVKEIPSTITFICYIFILTGIILNIIFDRKKLLLSYSVSSITD